MPFSLTLRRLTDERVDDEADQCRTATTMGSYSFLYFHDDATAIMAIAAVGQSIIARVAMTTPRSSKECCLIVFSNLAWT
jgi:hypothetical protein